MISLALKITITGSRVLGIPENLLESGLKLSHSGNLL
jgi:hypothetical protein